MVPSATKIFFIKKEKCLHLNTSGERAKKEVGGSRRVVVITGYDKDCPTMTSALAFFPDMVYYCSAYEDQIDHTQVAQE